MDKRKSIGYEGIIAGFALFATFFGAGNLIFPPDIGLHTGNQWVLGSLGLLATGIILPILSIIAISNTGNSSKTLMDHVSPWYYTVFYLLTTTLIGMGSTMPRVAATTHEIGISTVFPNVPIAVTVVIFFILIYIFTSDQHHIVDRVGKYLTPVLLLFLLAIILKTFISPIGTPQATGNDHPFTSSMLTGYLTGDLITGIITANIFLANFAYKGFNRKELKKGIFIASIVSVIGLFIIYGGLVYLGATGTDIVQGEVGKAELLVQLVRESLGTLGLTILAVAVSLACLTTGIGISATVAAFLADFTKDKISYKMWLIIICIVGTLLGVSGVDRLVDYVTPLFLVIYPMCIVMTFLGLINHILPNDGAYKGGVLMAFLFSLGDAILSTGIQSPFLAKINSLLPLSSIGFGWLVPTIIGMIAGLIIFRGTGKVEEDVLSTEHVGFDTE